MIYSDWFNISFSLSVVLDCVFACVFSFNYHCSLLPIRFRIRVFFLFFGCLCGVFPRVQHFDMGSRNFTCINITEILEGCIW